MIAGLRVPYRDTSADALCWVFGLPVQPAHAVLDVPVGPHRLQLRILGASHQVLLRNGRGPAAAVALSETVACLPGAPPGLPDRAERRTDGLRYRLSTEVHRCATAADFDAEVTKLLATYRADARALVGRFPGHPLAVTVLAAEPAPVPSQVRWSSWHAYPGQREIVRTGTTVELETPVAG